MIAMQRRQSRRNPSFVAMLVVPAVFVAWVAGLALAEVAGDVLRCTL